MLTRAELKQQAKAQLKGNLGMLLVVLLVYFLVCLAVSLVGGFIFAKIPVLLYVITYAVVPPIALGYCMVYLDTTYGEKPQVATLFRPYKECWLNSVLVNILVAVFTLLWSLLLIIPGIIKSFSYSQAYFILAENPGMTAKEAIDESKLIMDGHKMELFVLYLSFIPWFLLGYVTLGLGFIYVAPYMTLTLTNYYHNIKRQNAPAVETAAYQEAEVVE